MLCDFFMLLHAGEHVLSRACVLHALSQRRVVRAHLFDIDTHIRIFGKFHDIHSPYPFPARKKDAPAYYFLMIFAA